MQFGLDFLTIQAQYAERVAALADIPLTRALFLYTSLPIRFGVPFGDLVETHSDWQAFLSALQASGDLPQTVAAFHARSQRSLLGLFPTRPQFGCFSFEYLPHERAVRPHFANRDAPYPGALHADHVPTRKAELTAMFQNVHARFPEARTVIGLSWLYNLPAYRRLFPPAFTASLTPLPHEYHSLGLWGQFLNKRGTVKPDLRDHFLTAIRAAADLRELEASFPLSALRAQADVTTFYRFYSQSAGRLS